MIMLQDESQKVAATTEVKAKDIPDSVNHTDKLEVRSSSCESFWSYFPNYITFSAMKKEHYLCNRECKLSGLSRSLDVKVLLGMQEEFQKAVAEAKDIPDSIDHMDKLALYGLFKTATVGKCNIGKQYRV